MYITETHATTSSLGCTYYWEQTSPPPKFQTTMAYTWIPNVCWLVLLLFPHINCHRPPIPSKHHNTNSAPEDLPSNLAKRNTDCTQGQKYPE